MADAGMTLLDHFAENLAHHNLRTRDEGGDVAKAAAKLGQSKAWGQRMLKQLRAELGPQAD
jgi:hypothetical protein